MSLSRFWSACFFDNTTAILFSFSALVGSLRHAQRMVGGVGLLNSWTTAKKVSLLEYFFAYAIMKKFWIPFDIFPFPLRSQRHCCQMEKRRFLHKTPQQPM
jgi:hypothetical protein